MKVSYISGSTYINDFNDNGSQIRIDNLSICEALSLALDVQCYFDYEDIISIEEKQCKKFLMHRLMNKLTLNDLLEIYNDNCFKQQNKKGEKQ